MSDSILTSIKKRLGIMEEYKHFDEDVIMDINTTFSKLTQLGVGPELGFRITGDKEVWSDYISEDYYDLLECVKSYMFLEVRMLFDPPVGSVAETYKQAIAEWQWRITVIMDTIADMEG